MKLEYNKYENPKMEVILFDSEDVIATSDPNELPGVNPFAADSEE